MFCGSKILASFTIAVRKGPPPPPQVYSNLARDKGGRRKGTI